MARAELRGKKYLMHMKTSEDTARNPNRLSSCLATLVTGQNNADVSMADSNSSIQTTYSAKPAKPSSKEQTSPDELVL